MLNRPGDYSIRSVAGQIDDELRREVVAFWVGNGALPSRDQAAERADELLCVARNKGGEIVGVNTAYVTNLRSASDRYYYYRMFIRKQDRHMHLAFALVKASVKVLRGLGESDPTVDGAYLETENPKLMKRSGRRVLAYLGWDPIGKNQRGLDVWTIEFRGDRTPRENRG